jgi:MFS family permease
MRRPFHEGVALSDALGVIGIGVAIYFGIAGILATLNTNTHGYRWYWPTNAMITSLLVIAVGLGLLMVSFRGKRALQNRPVKRVFTGTSEKREEANKRIADKVRKHISEGIPPAGPEPSDAPRG